METAQVSEAIEALCSKFSITTTFLISEMTKYYIANYSLTIFFATIFLILGIYIAKKGINEYKDDLTKYKDRHSDYYSSHFEPELEDYPHYFIPSAAIIICSTMIIIGCAHGLIMWLVSPTAAFANKIIASLR